MASDKISEAQSRMKSYYDKNRKIQEFKIGDKVLLDGRNLQIHHKGFKNTAKFAPRFIGPFQILDKIQKDSYKLSLSKGLKLHPVFHTSLLKPYEEDNNREQAVPKVLLKDGTEGQLVKQVIGHRKRNGIQQYKIWWLGETQEKATWEPGTNLTQIPGLIQQYWESKKSKSF